MKRLLSLTFLMLCGIPMAFAVNSISYVASYGSDSNICVRSSPCLTFARAISQTTNNGEVHALDSADFGGFYVNQQMLIDGGPGMASVFFPPQTIGPCGVNVLICINGITSGYVTLRNLTLNTFTSAVGIIVYTNSFFFLSSASVQIENVQVLTPAADCVDVQVGTVVLKNTNLRNCAGVGVNVTGGSVSLENVLIQNAAGGAASASGGSLLAIRNSNLNQNTGTLVSASTGATITVDSSSLSNCNPTPTCKGVVAQSSGVVELSNTTVIGNGVGLSATGGSIVSFVNNRIYGNGTNGAPTLSVYQK